ncbi:phytoene synthase [Streptomonospora nanhaiensis]|uniref:Phytoene synthase n=1 Tax=Streptomonospora nanhaiensis TaxID=1323731 RepID=A0A853BJ26_9ACTN|nr:phytoene synthase [Streptomonospora nanhaiensis]
MSTASELDAAGIGDPALRAAYARCRALHARHGRTYYLATRVLPPDRRPSVHALYGFARWVDDVVDDLGVAATTAERLARLDAVEADLRAALAGAAAREPVVAALAHTARRHAIPSGHFTAFMGSMRADLTVDHYATYADLRGYMYGSAQVIGLQMVPVLGTVVPPERAAPHAAALGEAFQLTNFLRDVAEDLDRGRVYLPADVLAAHGADRGLLERCRRTRTQDPRVRAALAEMARLNRDVYRVAEPGCAMLDPVARPCIATALRLYRGILDEIEAADYDVWTRRHRVPTARRLRVALPALGRAAAARAGAARRRRTADAGLPRVPRRRTAAEQERARGRERAKAPRTRTGPDGERAPREDRCGAHRAPAPGGPAVPPPRAAEGRTGSAPRPGGGAETPTAKEPPE